MIFWVAIIIYIACSILTYGLQLAYFQGRYPFIAKQYYNSDRVRAFVSAMLGPFSLFWVYLYHGGRYGLKFR